MHRISSTSFRIYQSTQVPTGRNTKLMHERNIGLHFQCCRSFSIFHWQGCLTATCCEAMVRHRWSALAEPLKARGHEIHTFTRALCCVIVLTHVLKRIVDLLVRRLITWSMYGHIFQNEQLWASTFVYCHVSQEMCSCRLLKFPRGLKRQPTDIQHAACYSQQRL